MEHWVFVVWFLMQDGTIPQPQLHGPFLSYALCEEKRDEFRTAPPEAKTAGYLMTNCRTKTGMLKSIGG